jgi:Zn-dependent protease/CBS domain-containing protein
MRGSFKIGHIAGIEIGIHYTWIFALIFFSWIFAAGTFPVAFPEWSSAAYWISGIILALFLFISVLLHELCHSLVAQKKGMKVKNIVLFIFGGVSNIESEPEKPGIELIMAGAGPLSSLILGGVFYGIFYALGGRGINVSDQSTPLVAIVFYLAYMNILLAIFNIIPAFPLDGGRVLRAVIWGATKNLRKATMIAGSIGRFLGWAMILFGIALLFNQQIWIFSGGIIDSIWIIFIGWFLVSAADNSMRESTMQQQLAGVHVKDVMDHSPECISPAVSVESIVQEAFLQRGRRALPVCRENILLGIVTLADIKRIPQDRWPNTPVQEIMTRSPLLSVKEDDDLNNALKVLAENGLNQIPVLNEGRLAGLLTRADVLRYLQTKQELGIKNSRNTGAPA